MTKRPAVFAAMCLCVGIYMIMENINQIYPAMLAALLALYMIFYRPRMLRLLLFGCIIFMLGALRVNIKQSDIDKKALEYDGKVIRTDAVALDFSSNNSFPAEITVDGKKIKIYLYMEDGPKLKPGEAVNAQISLSVPESNNSFIDFSDYLSGRNIFLSGYTEKAVKTEAKCSFVKKSLFAQRRRIDKLSRRFFKGDIRAMFNALLLGDKHLLTDELKNSLRKAGQNHIAVVSGMHLSLMCSAIMYIVRAVFGRGRVGNIFAILSTVFITLLTGAGASVVRACIMMVLYYTARLINRESDGASSLGISIIIMLMYNPFLMRNVGYVLSVLSVTGIELYSEKIKAAITFMPKKASEAAAVCISAQMCVIPAVMYYFGMFAPYALFANLMVFIFASGSVIFGMIFIVTGAIPIISDIFAAFVNFFIYAVISICEFIGELPYSTVNVRALTLPIAIAFAAFLAALYIYPEHKKRLRFVFSAAIICICAVIYLKTGVIEAKVIKASTGDSICLLLPKRRTVTAGCIEYEEIEGFADRYSDGKIEYIIQTKKDIREIQKAAENNKVKNIVLNKDLCTKSSIKKLAETNANIIYLGEKDKLAVGGGVTVMYESCADLKDGAAVRMETEKSSIVAAQEIQKESIDALFKSGVKIPARYFYSKNISAQQKLAAIFNGENMYGKKVILLKK